MCICTYVYMYTCVYIYIYARDTNRNVQIIHEQATRVRAPDQRGVHACVVGDELNALGCIWLKTSKLST